MSLKAVSLLILFMLVGTSVAHAYDASFRCFNSANGFIVTVNFDLDWPYRKPQALLHQRGKLIFSDYVIMHNSAVYGGPFHLKMHSGGIKGTLTYFRETYDVECPRPRPGMIK